MEQPSILARARGVAKRAWNRKAVIEGIVGLFVFVGAAYFGWYYLNRWTTCPQGMNPWWFRPSVMVAAGRGYIWPNASVKKLPQLEEFLDGKAESFDPALLPKNPRTSPVTGFHEAHQYLFRAIGYTWRWLGIRWQALKVFCAAFFAISVALCYGVFRLGLGRMLSLLGTAAFMLQPSHLAFLPHVRDYAKTPFVLLALLLIGRIVSRPFNTAKLLLLSAFLGLSLGVGYGFRADLVVCVLIAIPAIAFFLPANPRRRRWEKGVAILLLVAGFLATSAPIFLTTTSKEEVQWGHLIQGLSANHDAALSVGGTPYRVVYAYSDALMYFLAASYAHRVLGVVQPVEYRGADFGASCFGFMMDVVRTFPADLCLRAETSVLRLLQAAPWTIPEKGLSYNDFLSVEFHVAARVMEHLSLWGPWYATIALLMLSARTLRLGLGTAYLLLTFAGYPSLQFHERHYFHLGFLSLWAALFVWSQVACSLASLRGGEMRRALWRYVSQPATWWTPSATRMATCAGLVIAVLFVPLAALRACQNVSVGRLYARYARAEGESLPVQDTPVEGDATGVRLARPQALFDPAKWSEDEQRWTVHSKHIMVEMTGTGLMRLRSRYRTENWENDFTTPETIPVGEWQQPGRVKRFSPVFSVADTSPWGAMSFEGIQYLPNQEVQISGIHQVPELDDLHLQLWLTLPENWTSTPRFQRRLPMAFPFFLRARLAAYRNLLPDGQMAVWEDDAKAPQGFGAPTRCSTIQPDQDFPSKEGCAIRQTWNAYDGKTGPYERFHTALSGLAQARKYELFVVAANEGRLPVSVSIWQVMSGTDGKAITQPIARNGIIVAGGTPRREYSYIFSTPLAEWFSIIITTEMASQGEPQAFPVSAVFDDWRLAFFESPL